MLNCDVGVLWTVSNANIPNKFPEINDEIQWGEMGGFGCFTRVALFRFELESIFIALNFFYFNWILSDFSCVSSSFV